MSASMIADMDIYISDFKHAKQQRDIESVDNTADCNMKMNGRFAKISTSMNSDPSNCT